MYITREHINIFILILFCL